MIIRIIISQSTPGAGPDQDQAPDLALDPDLVLVWG